MKEILIPMFILAGFSTGVAADQRWHGDERGYGHHGHKHHHHHQHQHEHPVVQHIVVQPAYGEPRVIYQAPPQVIYRDRVIYRDVPAYYEAPPAYQPPTGRYYSQSQPLPAYDGNRVVMSQAIGAVAGGVIGNQFGKGNGRVAATAAGAVIGSMVGGNMVGYSY